MSTRITFIRHLQQTSHKVVDAPIKKDQEVRSGGTKYDIIICSPYLRTRQTAELYESRTSLEYQELMVDNRICEYQCNKALKSFRLDKITEKYAPIPDSSETWEECVQRIDAFIDYVLELEGNVLVVAHGIVVNYASEKLLSGAKWPRGRDVPFGGGFTVRVMT